MVVDRSDAVDLAHDERFAGYLRDPFTPYSRAARCTTTSMW
jgi:hypothetical protein